MIKNYTDKFIIKAYANPDEANKDVMKSGVTIYEKKKSAKFPGKDVVNVIMFDIKNYLAEHYKAPFYKFMPKLPVDEERDIDKRSFAKYQAIWNDSEHMCFHTYPPRHPSTRR